MNRKLFLLVPFIAIALVVFNSFEPSEREQYTQYINNHPFSKDKIDPRLMDEMDKKDRPDLAMRQNFLIITCQESAPQNSPISLLYHSAI